MECEAISSFFLPVIARNYVRIDLSPPPRVGRRHFVIAFCDETINKRYAASVYVRWHKTRRMLKVKGPFPSVSAFDIFNL